MTGPAACALPVCRAGSNWLDPLTRGARQCLPAWFLKGTFMQEQRESSAHSTTSGTATNAADTPTPAGTGSIQEVAAQAIGLLDQVEGLIPGFRHFDTNDARRVAAGARFAKDLIPEVITTVTTLPPIGGINTFDVEGGKAALALDEALRPVVRRLSSLLDGVEFTIDNALARSGGQALSTYAWAKKHAKGPEGVSLRPYLDGMTRTVKRALNRRKSAGSTTSPSTPAPPSTEPPKGAQGFLAPKVAQANAALPSMTFQKIFVRRSKRLRRSSPEL
jgi:hypothetical protein